ncbi:immunoglobulin-like domain-containing protein [Lactonifactor longoviformis]|uniref:immunoglobulin-like domain-containing protein n=1 Tax=Lactonifactor longoviformis TaxID=341220 RepID=UPI0036F1ADBD
MKKSVILILAGCIIITAGVACLVYTTDREGPVIQIDETTDLTYTEGQDKEELLRGVTAIDKKDGDVSDTLMVESIVPALSGNKATVTFVAVDKHNNVTKYQCEINYQGAAGADTEAPPEDQNTDTEAKDTAEDTPDTGEETPEAQETGGAPESQAPPADETEAAISQLPEGSPAFRLTEHQITLKKGTKFNYMDYIREITDDKDSREDLYRKIRVSGEVKTSQAGTYEVSYSVTDSDGHQSNVEKLQVTVE